MKKRIKLKRLGRTTSHRKSMVRNMLQSLIRYDHVETTLAKAKVLKGAADSLVSYAKRANISDEVKNRYLKGYLTDSLAHKKLLEELAPRFANRVGGFTTLYRVRDRLNDGSVMARVEWLTTDVTVKPKAETDKTESKAEEVKAEIQKPKAETEKAEKPAKKKVTKAKVKKEKDGQKA